jgi:hypothetical protein
MRFTLLDTLLDLLLGMKQQEQQAMEIGILLLPALLGWLTNILPLQEIQ